MKNNIFYIILSCIFIQCSNPPKELKYVPEKGIITIENNQLSYHPETGYKIELYTIDLSIKLKRKDIKKNYYHILDDNDRTFNSSLKKVKEITEQDFNKLLNNFNTFDREDMLESEFCYSPRDAFLIKNEKGEVATCIEVCFECHEIRIKSKICYDISNPPTHPDSPLFTNCNLNVAQNQSNYLETYIQIQK